MLREWLWMLGGLRLPLEPLWPAERAGEQHQQHHCLT